MRWIFAVLCCLLGAHQLAIWSFAQMRSEALSIPNGASISISVRFYDPEDDDLHLHQVVRTQACGGLAGLLSQSHVVRGQIEAEHPVWSGIVMVMAKSVVGRGEDVIYRSGNLTRDETATDVTLIAIIQAEACGLTGDYRSQATWLQVIDVIKQLQNAENRPEKETTLEL